MSVFLQVELGQVQVGDVVKYHIVGRELRGEPITTMQFVLEVNEVGDVRTEKDGWRPAGSFTFHRPMPRSERQPSLQDWSIFLAGRSWFIHGQPYAKNRAELTERQKNNGGRRAKLEIERVQKRNAQRIAATPPLFEVLSPAVLEKPRYSTAEEANAENAARRLAFVTKWRNYAAGLIWQIRRELAQLDAHTLAAYHRYWDRRSGGQGLVYLSSFLRDPGCASSRQQAVEQYPKPQLSAPCKQAA